MTSLLHQPPTPAPTAPNWCSTIINSRSTKATRPDHRVHLQPHQSHQPQKAPSQLTALGAAMTRAGRRRRNQHLDRRRAEGSLIFRQLGQRTLETQRAFDPSRVNHSGVRFRRLTNRSRPYGCGMAAGHRVAYRVTPKFNIAVGDA